MALRLHIWVGKPQSVSDLTPILDSLHRLTSVVAAVVYEKKDLEIYDLAEGFADTSEVQIAIEACAKSLGINLATAMFGLKAEAESFQNSCPQGLTYLGSFESQEEGVI